MTNTEHESNAQTFLILQMGCFLVSCKKIRCIWEDTLLQCSKISLACSHSQQHALLRRKFQFCNVSQGEVLQGEIFQSEILQGEVLQDKVSQGECTNLEKNVYQDG